MILVASSFESDFVVLEGHLRITSIHLAEKFSKEHCTVMLGISKEMIRWSCY